MADEQENLRSMLDELLDTEDANLSSWEINFLDSIDRWEGDFTVDQSNKLKQIYEKAIK